MTRILSFSFRQDEILEAIMALHNGGEPFDCDATYSTGMFYRRGSVPAPRLKFDICPQVAGVEKADARRLPLADASIGSMVFDPPFVIKNPKRANGHFGIVESRFSGYGSAGSLYTFYRDSLVEFWGVLLPGGLLVFKCQDVVSGGRQHWSHFEVMRLAFALGFEGIDAFILASRHPMWSPNMSRQQHARKAHSYFLVFRKPAPQRRRGGKVNDILVIKPPGRAPVMPFGLNSIRICGVEFTREDFSKMERLDVPESWGSTVGEPAARPSHSTFAPIN